MALALDLDLDLDLLVVFGGLGDFDLALLDVGEVTLETESDELARFDAVEGFLGRFRASGTSSDDGDETDNAGDFDLRVRGEGMSASEDTSESLPADPEAPSHSNTASSPQPLSSHSSTSSVRGRAPASLSTVDHRSPSLEVGSCL